MANGICDQVAKNTFHQYWIGVHRRAAGAIAKQYRFSFGFHRMVIANSIEQRLDGESLRPHVNDSGIEPGNVQYGTEKTVHGICGFFYPLDKANPFWR